MSFTMPQLPSIWSPRGVRDLRIRLDLTNERFASVVGVAVRTVIRWQTGEECPSPLARRALDDIASAIATPTQAKEGGGGLATGVGRSRCVHAAP